MMPHTQLRGIKATYSDTERREIRAIKIQSMMVSKLALWDELKAFSNVNKNIIITSSVTLMGKQKQN
jgi:hypothetical protein